MNDSAAPTQETDTPAPSGEVYRVLARKYRPQHFGDLIGQEPLVRTLTNALERSRLPHAIILSGVRGVGKTTTARIIAKAINYRGPDGKGEPSVAATDDCPICRAIAEDRHPDVVEMDAASRTGVDDVREIIEGVRYRPVEARYKVYIIDEVHMLSKNAFNALLKTLEEPPEHVVFIFATTEIRKVPITVLSRCQRFDLRRVEKARLEAHFAAICEKEAVTADKEALALIARAADGSVRDGLSLLDQAIALSGDTVTTEVVETMLGLADRARVLDLFAFLVEGRIAEALDCLGQLYAHGAEPFVVLQDLMETTHQLTRRKLLGATADDAAGESARLDALAEKLSMPQLGRCWQMLVKGAGEVQYSDRPLPAAEMALIRLAFASDLPDPAELVRRLTAEKGAPSDTAGKSGGSQPGEAPPPDVPRASASLDRETGPPVDWPSEAPEPEMPPADSPPADVLPVGPSPPPEDFRALVALCRTRREVRLADHLTFDVDLVRFAPGRLELRLRERAPSDLPNRLKRLLKEWTGDVWNIAVDPHATEHRNLGEELAAEDAARRERALQHPLVKAALETFPEAEVTRITGEFEAEDNEQETGGEAASRGERG